MTDEEMLDIIDNMDYFSLLRRWRFSKVGDPFFQGDVGKYYAKRLNRIREVIGEEEAARISKLIGWEE